MWDVPNACCLGCEIFWDIWCLWSGMFRTRNAMWDVWNVYLGYGLSRMWEIWDMRCSGCLGCGMFVMWMLVIWGVWNVGCSVFGMLGMWDFWYVELSVRGTLKMCNFWDFECSGCRLFWITDFLYVGSFGYGILRMWVVRKVEWSGFGIWERGCLQGCRMLIYKFLMDISLIYWFDDGLWWWAFSQWLLKMPALKENNTFRKTFEPTI